MDTYGTVQPHTLIRQHLDYGHWYDRNRLSLKDIHNCQYIAAMNPTAGSFTINPRLQRHFHVFAVRYYTFLIKPSHAKNCNDVSFSFPGADALTFIYQAILSQHLSNAEHKFPLVVQRLCENIVTATVALHHKVAQIYLPTAVKFHYIFNLRDISNIFQVRTG